MSSVEEVGRYRGRIVAETGFHLPHDSVLKFSLPGLTGQCELQISTFYVNPEAEPLIPQSLVMDFTDLPATSVDEASEAMRNVSSLLIPLLALIANSRYYDPEVVVVYDASPELQDHPLRFQQVQLRNDPVEVGSRKLDPALVGPVFDGFMRHDAALKIHRAIVHYNEALLTWKPGLELRAAIALWIATENISPLALEMHKAATNKTNADLAEEWSEYWSAAVCKECGQNPFDVRGQDLHAAARRFVILEGDDDTYDKASRLRHGFQHGFKSFPDMHELSKAVRDPLAKHVRRFLLSCLVDDEALGALVAEPHDKPHRADPVVVSWDMVLKGDSANLAPEGQLHPGIHLTGGKVERVELTDKGGGTTRRELSLKFEFGEGVSAEIQQTRGSDRMAEGSVSRIVITPEGVEPWVFYDESQDEAGKPEEDSKADD